MQSWQPLRLLPWLSLCPAMWPQLSLSQAMQTDHLLLLGLQDLPAHLEAFFAAVVSGHRQIEKMKLGIRGGQTSSTPGRWTWIASAWRLSRAFFGWPFLGGCFCCACVATSLLGRLLFSHADFAWSLTASGFVRSLTHHGLRVRQSLYKVRWTPLHERASLKEPGDATSLQPLHCLDHTP